MASISINFFVLTILLVVLALADSALAKKHEPKDQQASYVPDSSITTNESPPPQPQQPNPTCRKIGQLCTGFGSYGCCEGLYCLGYTADKPGGNGFCTPLDNHQPPPKVQCKKQLQMCHPYGPYVCCEGLHCIDPQNLPTVAGVETRKMKLPPGAGVCNIARP